MAKKKRRGSNKGKNSPPPKQTKKIKNPPVHKDWEYINNWA